MALFSKREDPVIKELKKFEEKLDELYKDDIPDLSTLSIKDKSRLFNKYIGSQYLSLMSSIRKMGFVQAIKQLCSQKTGNCSLEEVYDFLKQLDISYVEDFLEFADYNDDVIDECVVCIQEDDYETFTNLISACRKSKRVLCQMYEIASEGGFNVVVSDNPVNAIETYVDEEFGENINEQSTDEDYLEYAHEIIKEVIYQQVNYFNMDGGYTPKLREYIKNKAQSILDSFPTEIDSFAGWMYHTYLSFNYELYYITYLGFKDSSEPISVPFTHILEKIISHPSASELRVDTIYNEEHYPDQDDNFNGILPRPKDLFKDELDKISNKLLPGQNLAYFCGYPVADNTGRPEGVKWEGDWAKLVYFLRVLYVGTVKDDKIDISESVEEGLWERASKVFYKQSKQGRKYPKLSTLKNAPVDVYCKPEYKSDIDKVMKDILILAERKI